MIFSTGQRYEAFKLPFNWVAEYFDGTYLSEYDFSSQKENSFYAINQDFTIRFGLVGQGAKIFFEKFSGVFNLNGHRLEVIYREGNKDYHLTNTNSKKDLITYKEAVSDMDLAGGGQRTAIQSINFGYKTNIFYDDLQFHFQPIVSLPSGKAAELQIKLTSNKELNGEIIFKRSGVEIEKFHAPLSEKESGHVNWTIK